MFLKNVEGGQLLHICEASVYSRHCGKVLMMQSWVSVACSIEINLPVNCLAFNTWLDLFIHVITYDTSEIEVLTEKVFG